MSNAQLRDSLQPGRISASVSGTGPEFSYAEVSLSQMSLLKIMCHCSTYRPVIIENYKMKVNRIDKTVLLFQCEMFDQVKNHIGTFLDNFERLLKSLLKLYSIFVWRKI